jgi:hypothetical protein
MFPGTFSKFYRPGREPYLILIIPDKGRKANAAQGMVPHQLVAKRCEFPPRVLNGPKLGTATSLGWPFAAEAHLITQQ